MSGSLGKNVALALGLVAVGTAVFLFVRRTDAPVVPPVQAPAVVTQAPAAKPAEPVVAPLPTPESAGIPVDDCIAYPDGTRLPPLNGVKKAPQMVFHRLIPFAKVVRKEFDKATGLEWYIHENGVRSTTHLQWKNGVQEAFAEIEIARPALPVDAK